MNRTAMNVGILMCEEEKKNKDNVVKIEAAKWTLNLLKI